LHSTHTGKPGAGQGHSDPIKENERRTAMAEEDSIQLELMRQLEELNRLSMAVHSILSAVCAMPCVFVANVCL
jgi:hypothetical protein